MKKKIIATISALFMIMTLTGGAVMTTASGHSEKKPVVAASTIPNRDEISTSRSTERSSLSVSEEMMMQRKARQEQPAKTEPTKKVEIKAVVRVTPKPKKTYKPVVKHHKTYKSAPLHESNSGNPRTYAMNVLGATQFQCFSNIVERESGWNPYAQNPSSGAYGLVQALPGSKMSSAGSDWRTNPITQVRWGIHYMNSRYGSPCGAWSFWQGHHYY